jgi:Asp-tRNA(Asn)/Glu-tRNA(Gln) amidotransferase B subunit
MEEDTGKTTHIGGGGGRIHGAAHSLVDYNRAGVPLVEIVSRPDLRTAEEAKAYVSELRAILVATGASDGKMEEGSLRVDANVSVRPGPDAEYGTRCEIKNMNSLRSLGRAIEYEAKRQIDLLEAGADPKRAINRAANEIAADLEHADRLTPAVFAEVVTMESSGTLTATQAKQVLAALLAGEGDDPKAIAAARGFEAMDASALEAMVDEVIAANAEVFEKFKAGDAKVSGMLVGQVMKRSQGKADGKAVTALLRSRAGL